MLLKVAVVLCIFLARELVAECVKTEKDLRRHLFPHQGYDRLVRPVKVPSNVVPVSVYLNPLAVRSLDFDSQTLKLDTWLIVQWHDEYLQWNPNEFGSQNTLNLPASEVWRPDIAVYTGTPDSANLPRVETNVVIKSNGDVIWVPPFTIENRCPTIQRNADRLECDISMLSWTYDVTQLDLNPRMSNSSDYNTSFEYFNDNYSEWHLESITPLKENKLFSCCPEYYPTIHFKVVLTRKT